MKLIWLRNIICVFSPASCFVGLAESLFFHRYYFVSVPIVVSLRLWRKKTDIKYQPQQWTHRTHEQDLQVAFRTGIGIPLRYRLLILVCHPWSYTTQELSKCWDSLSWRSSRRRTDGRTQPRLRRDATRTSEREERERVHRRLLFHDVDTGAEFF